MKKIATIKEKLIHLWWDIQYYIWDVPRGWYYNIKWLLSNFWRFKKILWNYRTWDFYHNAMLMSKSLEWLADDIEKGMEVDESREKKVLAIRELSFLFKYLVDDSDFGTDNDPKIWDGHKMLISTEELAKIQIERLNKTLDRIHHLLKGQEIDAFPYTDEWHKEFDGSGYNGWWE